MEKLYPLGTVIRLKNSVSIVMIIGYYPVNHMTQKIYHYVAVSYPMGICKGNTMILLDEESIDEVIYEAYANDEALGYNEQYFKLMEKMELKKETETKLLKSENLFF